MLNSRNGVVRSSFAWKLRKIGPFAGDAEKSVLVVGLVFEVVVLGLNEFWVGGGAVVEGSEVGEFGLLGRVNKSINRRLHWLQALLL